jgi:hypothetical protein
VGGHLDAWDNGEGAHDDGAGIVQSIEIIRIYKALGLKPKCTIRAVAFMNEENGGRGGKKYAEMAKLKNEKHIAAIESDDPAKREIVEATVRVIFAPVIDVHWVSVKQLAQLEPTLVETIACMIGALLKESLHEAVHTMGVPEPAARAILLGHTQVALANTLRGDNPFSDACMIAMDYGRKTIIRDDWKKVFQDDELDKNLAAMLHLEKIER